MYKSYVLWSVLTLVLLCNCSCDKSVGPNETSNNKMVVYPNGGNVLYLVDYQTFEVARTVELNIPESIGCFGMSLSTNKDFLVFPAMDLNPPFNHYIISYHIEQDSIYSIFPTGLDSIGAPRTIAAYITDKPGLIYFYSHLNGLYSIDFLNREVKTIFTTEWGPGVDFYHSPDKEWLIINKYIAGRDGGHHEIEFYSRISGLDNVQFILNKNNLDSIQVDDLAVSEDNKEVFVSIRLPQMRNIANYFGSYALETKMFFQSSISFPWSLNPYYIAYSPKRKECYLVGAQDKFYVVDTSTKDYTLKAVLDLTGKVPGPSRILLRPNEDVAFVSCVYNNLVLAIDLDHRRILKKIEMDAPYLMILL